VLSCAIIILRDRHNNKGEKMKTRVHIFERSFLVDQPTNDKAKREAVRLHIKKFGKTLSKTDLYAAATLDKPNRQKPGRKPSPRPGLIVEEVK